MKIIFDEKEVGSYGRVDDPSNTPAKLIERRRGMLEILGKFMGATSVEFIDSDKSEEYLITKKGQTLRLSICGNHYDGGWMGVSVGPKSAK